jgi:DNA-binding NtrC family response regulator
MNSKQILIADDEPNIQTMVRTCLVNDGYEVDQAYDGRAALNAITRSAPDLVLLDLAMPLMDGMALLSDLQDRHVIPQVRVVVMTAHGSTPTAVKAIRLGASDFLEKPFSPEDLRISIASVLDEPAAPGGERIGNYDDALSEIRRLLRSGKLAVAESLLRRAGPVTDMDARFLNLAGVVHEAHGRRFSARRFFQKALAADPAYQPATQNLWRQAEIEKDGHTDIPVALGDFSHVLTSGEMRMIHG